MAAKHRKIIHIDMDAFYASVEQRDFPEYRDQPIIVGGAPGRRGVVAAASYEARKFGVHSAMPTAKAVQLCPHVIIVKPRFEMYREVSRTIRAVFSEFSKLVEPLSLDEAYLDVTENHKDNPSATQLAQQIKNRIKKQTRLTASAGVSYNKFLAKIASDLHKPDGMAVIPPENAKTFIENLKIRSFPGVGSATEAKMKAMGIHTGKDLGRISEMALITEFGKSGSYFYRIVRGIDERPVRANRVHKSISIEHTFDEDIDDLNHIHRFLKQLAEKLSKRLKKKNAAGKTISLKIRYDDFETITRSHSFSRYLNNAPVFGETALKLLQHTEAGHRNIRLIGLTVSNLNLRQEGYFMQTELELK